MKTQIKCPNQSIKGKCELISVSWCKQAQYADWCKGCQYNENRQESTYQKERRLNDE